jgi:hypothetical protein
MHQGIKNWHLSILVIVISIISISLVQNYVLAQWNDPIGLPGETSGFRLVVNPMKEDLQLNGYDLIDNNLRIDANGPNAIQIKNNANICFNETSDCIASWSEISGGLWDQNGNKIYYNTDNVGIGTNDPSSALEIYSDVANGSNLKLQNSSGDMRLIFQEYNAPPTPYGDISIRYNGTVGGYNNWLEFWGRNPDTDDPIMTMQRDYDPNEHNYLGVGIGVPAETNISAKLRVQNTGSEDILQLWDGGYNSKVLTVGDNGWVGIGGSPHTGYKVSISDGNGTLKLNSDLIWAYQNDLELYASEQVYTHNYFGIGTDNPNKQLHILSHSGENAEIDIQSGTNNYWGIYQENTNGNLNFWNIDNRVTLTPLGNLSTSGTIQPGDYNTALTCLASDYGSIVWNAACSTNGCLQVCTQVGWLDLATN